MSKFISFFAGLIAGAYVAQNYSIPEVSSTVSMMITKISEYEKNYKKD